MTYTEVNINKIKGKGSTLNVVFIVDITGSMSNEIQAVKKMIKTFLKMPLEGMRLHVWTYTEDSKGCYVSKSNPNLSREELVDYVHGIKLCYPPDYPGVMAHGEDGPENVVAALANLPLSFSNDESVVTFLISDAEPHHKSLRCTKTAEHEIKYLKSLGYKDTDIFRTLMQVIDTLNVTIVPILFSGADSKIWYQQAAIATNGLVMVPASRNENDLADGLEKILDILLQVSNTGRVPASSIKDFIKAHGRKFSVLDLDEKNFELVLEDSASSVTRQCKKFVSAEELESSFLGMFSTACDRFLGKKVKKRSRMIDADIVAYSIQTFVYSLIFLVSENPKVLSKVKNVLDKSSEILLKTLEHCAETERNSVKKWLDGLPDLKVTLKEMLANPETAQVECVIQLYSVFDQLNELAENDLTPEDDVEELTTKVLQMLMVRLIDIEFPVDSSGSPDFNDAWSARIKKVSHASMISAASAYKLRDEDGLYTDPLTRETYSAAVLLAHPDDPITTLMYNALSHFVSLQNLLQSFLVSGGYRIFPAIVPGLLAASLLSVLRSVKMGEEITPAQYESARLLMWTLQSSQSNPAFDVVKSLGQGKGLNPIDHSGKLLLGILYFVRDNESQFIPLMRSFFEEISGEAIGSLLKGRNRGFQDEFYHIGKELVTEPIDAFDPLLSYHEIERYVVHKEPVSAESIARLKSFLFSSVNFNRIIKYFELLMRFIKCDLKNNDLRASLKLDDSSSSIIDDELLSDLKEIFYKSLIIERRVARYEEISLFHWQRIDECRWPQESGFLIDSLKRSFGNQIAEWNAVRLNHAKQELARSVVAFPPGLDQVEYNEKLKTLKFELLGKSYILDRMDVPEIIARCKDNLALCFSLVLGDWTSQPTAQLRSYMSIILPCFESKVSTEEFKNLQNSLSSRPLCQRDGSYNRHGHSLELQYPGFGHWSPEYDTKRRMYRYNGNLDDMKEFHDFRNEIMAVLSDPQEIAFAKLVFEKTVDRGQLRNAKSVIKVWMENPIPSSKLPGVMKIIGSKRRMAKVLSFVTIEAIKQ